jgi:hypothetical protein
MQLSGEVAGGAVLIVDFDADSTDAGGAPDLTLGSGHTGEVIIGSGNMTALTVTADSTGTAEVVLPAGSIDGTEILDNTIDSDDYIDGSVDPIHLANLTKSMYWGAAGMSADGTQCADPAEVTINSGPKLYTIICTDNDAGIIYGSTNMPDGWDSTVNPVFYFQALNTAADTGVLEFDFSAMCRADGALVDSTWGAEPTPGSITFTTANDIETSAANTVVPNGTCTGDSTHLFWRMSLDATATTTAVATAHVIGVKLEYDWNPED